MNSNRNSLLPALQSHSIPKDTDSYVLIVLKYIGWVISPNNRSPAILKEEIKSVPTWG